MKGTALPVEIAVTVSALVAARDFDRLRAAAKDLRRRGAAAADLSEAAYVASLFCGFPSAVAALVALAEDGGEVHRDRPPVDRGELRRRGERLFRMIHGTSAERQLSMLERVHPDLADTIVAEAYGRVLARDFLPLAARELGGVAALVVLGLIPQLRAHLLGARRTGATWEEIAWAVEHASGLAKIDGAAASALVAELRDRDPVG